MPGAAVAVWNGREKLERAETGFATGIQKVRKSLLCFIPVVFRNPRTAFSSQKCWTTYPRRGPRSEWWDQLNAGTSHRLLQQAGEKLSAAEAHAPVLEPVREMANFSDLCVPEIDVLVSSEQSKWAYQPINIRKWYWSLENGHSRCAVIKRLSACTM